MLNQAGEFREAEQCARVALERLKAAEVRAIHPSIAEAQEEAGIAPMNLNRSADARPFVKHALSIDRQLGAAYAESAKRVQALLDRTGRASIEQM